MTDNIPCIDCITLPICRAKLFMSDKTLTSYALYLSDKCSLAHDYITLNKSTMKVGTDSHMISFKKCKDIIQYIRNLP